MNLDEIGKYLERYDYDYFINDALSRIPEGVDTREGSIIFDALSPTCYQLAEFMFELKNILLETFVVTASGQYLEYRAEEVGLHRIPATKAIVRARFTRNNGTPFLLDIGSRFSSTGDEPVFYTVIANEDEEGAYRLQCETEGDIGNKYIGTLLPLDNFNGLAEAVLTDILIPARDAETDDDLRKRIIASAESVSFGGNISDYYYLTSNIDGVGAVQVYPVWDGGGTVRLVILDNLFLPASNVLVERVQNIIDPSLDGQGIGYAPIGHRVTVAPPTAKTINVTFEIVLTPGISYASVEENVKNTLAEHFERVRREWGERVENYYECWIFRSQIIAALLTVPGVINIQTLKLNDQEMDIQMELSNEKQELPILGEVKVL